jgi:PPP family 3-phenylpropionic acid transporter
VPSLRATPLKLGSFYAALCLSSGVGTPYIALWFKAHGLSGSDIGLILATPMLARVVIGPVLGVWADGFRLRRTAILWLAGVSVLGYGALLATSGLWAWLVVWFVGSTAYQACTPLADVITLRRAAREGFAYASARGIGSAAYILANIVAGALLPLLGPTLVVIWIIASGMLILIGARYLLTDDTVAESDSQIKGLARWRGAGALLRDPIFILMLLSVGFVQATHSFYYAFSTLIWRAQGISPSWSGLLWGVGVAVEVVFLWFGEPVRRRLGPERLLIAGAAGALLRWTALAFSPPLWLLFPIQALHALSFTASFIASLELTERLASRQHASAAQSLNASLSLGLMSGLATLASGPLYDHLGAHGYLAMSLSAALGLAGSIWLRGWQRQPRANVRCGCDPS